MILSKLTGWGLSEILSEPVDEIFAWLKAARKLEDEIAKETKAQMRKR